MHSQSSVNTNRVLQIPVHIHPSWKWQNHWKLCVTSLLHPTVLFTWPLTYVKYPLQSYMHCHCF